MTQNDLTKIAFEISTNIAALNSKFDSVMAKLADHEARIHQLEHTNTNEVENDQNFKDELLKLLAKTVTISIVVLGSVVGAGGVLSKLFNILN